ncbi:MAG TPA: hypothetical protein VFT45_06735 [Longimicrobium sp.]|nr:hypothetical protein [Longimicrobium sp.]
MSASLGGRSLASRAIMERDGVAYLHFETFIVYFVGKVVSHPYRQGGAVKSSIIRALLTLTAAGATVAGYGGMSTASATPPSSDPLYVTVTCGPNYRAQQSCVAEASGGSGTGYTFTWESATVTSEQGGISEATFDCSEKYSYTYESVSVTDSNNGYAEDQAQVWCSGW